MPSLRPATVSKRYLASRLEANTSQSPFAAHLRKPGGPERLDLDGLDAAKREFHALGGALNPEEVRALLVPHQALAAQTLFGGKPPGSLTRGTDKLTPPPQGPAGTELGAAWKTELDGPMRAPPVLDRDNSTVYQLTANNKLYALDRIYGSTLWSLELAPGEARFSDFQPMALSADGKSMAIATAPGDTAPMRLAKIDLTVPEVSWSLELPSERDWMNNPPRGGETHWAPPVITPKGTVVAPKHKEQRLVGYQAEDGEELWSYPLPDLHRFCSGAPLLSPDGRTAFYGFQREGGPTEQLALDAESGAVRWRHEQAASPSDFVLQTLSADGKTLYTARESGLTALDASTGKVQWSRDQQLEGSCNPPAISPDGTKLALAHMKGVVVYDARSGERLQAIDGMRIDCYPIRFSADGGSLLGFTYDCDLVKVSLAESSFEKLKPAPPDLQRGGGWRTDAATRWGFRSHGWTLEAVDLA
jgi:outer membrane protein assembly factor BamB